MKQFDLSDRVALVTGGNGGIGLGLARGLCAAGASVAICARDQDKSAAAVEELTGAGGEAIAFQCDVTDSESVKLCVAEITDRFGGLDILVNNAGTNIRKQPQDLTLDEWRTVLTTNLDSAFLCSQLCYPALKTSGRGKIINNGSMLSLFGSPWGAAYAASKGGIVQLTKSLATAWAADNIQVNCLLPGWIDTALTRRARAEVDGLNDRVLARTPAARWGSIDDFQGIAAFLGGPASDFISGASIPVDGGFSVNLF